MRVVTRIGITLLVLLGSLLPAGSPRLASAANDSPWVPSGLQEIERGSRTLDEIASGFPNPAEAAANMRAWGWSGNLYFNYAGMTAAGTNSLEVSFHIFASPAAAAEAMVYYAAGRSAMWGFSLLPVGVYGDEALAIGGLRDGVNEYTLYLRVDSLLVRISGVAPVGDPTPDVLATAAGVLTGLGVTTSASTGPQVDGMIDLGDFPYGWVITKSGQRDATQIADTFLRPDEALPLLTSWGFQVNIFSYFASGNGAPLRAGGSTVVETSYHVFGSVAGALDALPYYGDGRIEALGLSWIGQLPLGTTSWYIGGWRSDGTGYEVTVYMVVGTVLVRVSAISPNGDPGPDAFFYALQIATEASLL